MITLTPSEFAKQIVVPTVRDFRDDRRSRQRAYLACIVTYHLKDHLKNGGFDLESAMKTFNDTGAFEAVRSVCTSAKHKHLKKSKKYSDTIPFSAGEDYDRPPARAGVMISGLSRAGDAHGGREIASHLGGLDLYVSVKTVLKCYQFFFEALLADVNFQDC